MNNSQRKKKFSFAIAGLFEVNQNITYFDAEGEPIRKKKRQKRNNIHSSDQTRLL